MWLGFESRDKDLEWADAPLRAVPGIGLKPQSMMEKKGGRGKSLGKRDIGGRYNDFRRILYS